MNRVGKMGNRIPSKRSKKEFYGRGLRGEKKRYRSIRAIRAPLRDAKVDGDGRDGTRRRENSKAGEEGEKKEERGATYGAAIALFYFWALEPLVGARYSGGRGPEPGGVVGGQTGTPRVEGSVRGAWCSGHRFSPGARGSGRRVHGWLPAGVPGALGVRHTLW